VRDDPPRNDGEGLVPRGLSHSESVAADSLEKRAAKFSLAEPSLRQMVAQRVLSLFHWSLVGTLCFAAMLVLIDALFIWSKVITPEQRLMTQNIITIFVTATVVQVGAALAAIVYAVFKTENPDRPG
jgi:hypothetical protein